MKRIIASLATLAVAASLAGSVQATEAVAASSSPQAAVGYTTFRYPRLVATFMVGYLNNAGSYSGVHATEANRYRVTLKGRYTGYPFTAYLTKVSSQTVRITLYVLGQHMSKNVKTGFDL
jgi:hypothetical protein